MENDDLTAVPRRFFGERGVRHLDAAGEPGHEGDVMHAHRLPVLVLAFVGLTAVTGCAHVAPYERAKIAHPTMVASDLAGTGESHVRGVLEGATGGTLGAASGCGCN
jgi:hypothetical protein